MKTQIENKAFEKQGHRGCRALMPENTIPAMYEALDLGVHTLELDVVITKDEQVIVSHEPFFNHEISTKPDGTYVSVKEERSLNIYQMTYEETLRFDVGMKPHPRFPLQKKMKVTKPLLSDLIDSVEAYCSKKNIPLPFYNIETKTQIETDNIFHPAPAGFISILTNLIKTKKIDQRVIIQSFDVRTLQQLNTLNSSILTALLIDEGNATTFDRNITILGFAPDIYSPHYSLVDERLIKKCHEKNIRIIPWTVNNKHEIVALKNLGVDGIITDDPNLFN